MGWIKDFENWTKTGTSFGDVSPYLAGKEGWLPDGKIKGKPVGEVFSSEGYKAGGEWYRKAITSRGKEFAGGLLGTGKLPKKNGNDSGLPFGVPLPEWWSWSPPSAEDFTGMIPEMPKITIPEFPKIPEIPTLDLSPFATGLTGMGAGLGQGLAGLGGIPQMPQMPSLTGNGGEPDMSLIVALAVIGVGGMYLMKK